MEDAVQEDYIPKLGLNSPVREFCMKNLATTICLMIAVLLDCNLAISEEFKTISTRKDVTISFIENTPLKPIKAAAILFAGGDGNIGIDVNNKTVGSDNFLVRTRKLFSELGILTITPDAPSDMEYLKNIRNSLDYRTDISFLIKEINNKTTKPIWLIGTSRGSNTIGYHAPGLKIQGVALTATVTEGNNDTILDTDFKKIMVPTLVVHNKSDLCHVSPSWGAEIVFKQLPQTSRKHLLLFDHDGGSHGRDCGATTPHGFLGIEKKVVSAMTEWMLNAVKIKK
jgi:hypothetical protein